MRSRLEDLVGRSPVTHDAEEEGRDAIANDGADPTHETHRRRRGLSGVLGRAGKVFAYASIIGAMALTHLNSTLVWSEAYGRLQDQRDSLERVVALSKTPGPSLESYERLSRENESLRRQRSALLEGLRYTPRAPPAAIDTLPMPVGSYVLEVDKPHQRFRGWQRTRYSLLADVPSSTGLGAAEKEREGDLRTPGGYFMVRSVENSSSWRHEGRLAYGKWFARLNYGSWDPLGGYDPGGHCSIGIHGTDETWLLGLEASEGCIRLPNAFLEEAVSEGFLSSGTVGFITPYDSSSFSANVAGYGRDRARKISGK